MKGWSGNQSPIKQKPKVDLQTALGNIQKRISNIFEGVNTNLKKGIKPQSESSGFGLNNAQKAQANQQIQRDRIDSTEDIAVMRANLAKQKMDK